MTQVSRLVGHATWVMCPRTGRPRPSSHRVVASREQSTPVLCTAPARRPRSAASSSPLRLPHHPPHAQPALPCKPKRLPASAALRRSPPRGPLRHLPPTRLAHNRYNPAPLPFVDRATLWKRLAERAVSGLMLAALQKAYGRVDMRVRVDGALGEAFASRQGVKQGCPLSMEVFGPFIETLADYVDASDRARARDSAHTVADSPMVEAIPCPR
jgi:hypothetical protein